MADGGPREALLTADYSAEMIEQIARFPRVRDRAIFVGHPGDIVPGTFGPGLPPIRDWTEQHHDFAGYITGFDPRQPADRQALGYRDDEQVCIVTAGGSGVGCHLRLRPLLGCWHLVASDRGSLEEVGEQDSGAGGTVGGDGAVVDLAADLAGDRGGDVGRALKNAGVQVSPVSPATAASSGGIR